ncbi:MAG: SPASM domain-containing protein [Phycisphaeraceae bacterium]|nr:SPASM domain-containing protein [Phycisphaeraceae bacterium]
MSKVIGLVVADAQRTPLGLPSQLGARVGGRTVLGHTLHRLARVREVSQIVVAHPAGQDLEPLLGGEKIDKPVSYFPVAAEMHAVDRFAAWRRSARKWAIESWRGGLGAMTCYDELLPVEPLLEAIKAHAAEAALLIGGDWMIHDPELADAVMALHLRFAQGMPMVFTQAAPGLCGIAISPEILEQLRQASGGTFGAVLGYDPQRPQQDPIGKDVCVQAPPAVRDCGRRMIADTPAGMRMFAWLEERMGDDLLRASAGRLAQEIVDAGTEVRESWRALPRDVTLELTPRRPAMGPITPQHHVALDRLDMTADAAMAVVRQLGADQDTVLTLGGLGDALLHPDWAGVVESAKRAGVLGVAIETDLRVDDATLDRLLDVPVDVIGVRLNADSPTVYQAAMGLDDYPGMLTRLERLLNTRNRRAAEDGGVAGVPWIVPRLVKTAATLEDMEMFFDRWTHYCGHAVIEPATPGRGVRGDLMADQSPVRMAPPKRCACRQLAGRMTILSDGRVALCDQDWTGEGAIGRMTPDGSLAEIWSRARQARRLHEEGRWDELPLCGGCGQWHRP